MIANVFDSCGNVLSYSEVGGKKRINITSSTGHVNEFRFTEETSAEVAVFLTLRKNEETTDKDAQGSKS